MPKQRFYAAMIDRADPTATPKWWGFGKTIYKILLEELLGEDYGSFLDPITGNDADVSIAPLGPGASFASTNFKFKKNSSKLAEDGKKIEEILNAITPINEVFKPLTQAEISEKLSTWLDLKDTDGGETIKGGAAPQKAGKEKEEQAEESNYKSLDEAFEAALKDE